MIIPSGTSPFTVLYWVFLQGASHFERSFLLLCSSLSYAWSLQLSQLGLSLARFPGVRIGKGFSRRRRFRSFPTQRMSVSQCSVGCIFSMLESGLPFCGESGLQLSFLVTERQQRPHPPQRICGATLAQRRRQDHERQNVKISGSNFIRRTDHPFHLYRNYWPNQLHVSFVASIEHVGESKQLCPH